jgi:hypothetical protein
MRLIRLLDASRLFINPQFRLSALPIENRQLILSSQEAILLTVRMMKLHTEPTNPMSRKGHELMTWCQLAALIEGQFDRFHNPAPVQPVG